MRQNWTGPNNVLVMCCLPHGLFALLYIFVGCCLFQKWIQARSHIFLKGQGSRSPTIGHVNSQKILIVCKTYHTLVVLNILRLCSFMCDILFQDKALNKLVLNGQIRGGSHILLFCFVLFFSIFRTFNWKIQQERIFLATWVFHYWCRSSIWIEYRSHFARKMRACLKIKFSIFSLP